MRLQQGGPGHLVGAQRRVLRAKKASFALLPILPSEEGQREGQVGGNRSYILVLDFSFRSAFDVNSVTA